MTTRIGSKTIIYKSHRCLDAAWELAAERTRCGSEHVVVDGDFGRSWTVSTRDAAILRRARFTPIK